MSDVQQRVAAKKFADRWKGRGDEKSDTHSFWLALLRDIFDVFIPDEYIKFEPRVKIENTSYMDGYIAETLVVIEQKKLGHDLLKAEKQSDGTMLTPFEQAKRYDYNLGYHQRAKWIVTCSFDKFHIYNMKNPHGEPVVIFLENLETDYKRLDFLVNPDRTKIRNETAVSCDAGKIVEKLYEELLNQCNNPNDPETLRQLNILCVRLVFCLYAEDAKIFKHSQFHDYLEWSYNRGLKTVHEDLKSLFEILSMEDNRPPYLNANVAAFPYVNGGLFDDEVVHIPPFNKKIMDLLLDEASASLNWSKISPTVFGALFESTINPITRRKGGMHYTSITDIHKIIDPLFLNELNEELEEINARKQANVRREKLKEFQDKLAGLVFLDPACGSGNFLTQTYLELRRLENKVLDLLFAINKEYGEIQYDTGNIIKVSISQFYGLEINNFAVKVAQAALWIAESQMMKETEDIVKMELKFLPLKSYANIAECNALRVDWDELVPKDRLNYIYGNPPFAGYSEQEDEQKEEIRSVYVDENGKQYKNSGKIDYVSAWYFKSSQFIQGTSIRAAYVSTNSITQGEQVASVWKPLFERFDIKIDFAYRTFKWTTEIKNGASVHCVIVGFSHDQALANKPVIYEGEIEIEAKHINPYLVDAPLFFIGSPPNPICDVPEMIYGSKPAGKKLLLSEKEYMELISKEPNAKPYIRRTYGSRDYINNNKRYCLWLYGIDKDTIKRLPLVNERVEKVRQQRLASKKLATVRSAETPMLFQEIRHCESEYIIVPSHYSENYSYLPIGFVPPEIIANNAVFMIPHADTYHFGILTSKVHNAWINLFCGCIKSDYRYSNTIVYNNFPWPEATEKQKDEIKSLAKNVLNVRDRYKDLSLATLYGSDFERKDIRPDLFKAHQELDRAVMKLYGFSARVTEAEIVGELMERYQSLMKGHK